jgi:hypothetical protein
MLGKISSKEYEAAVIEVNEPGLADAAKIDPAVTLARAEPFWTVFARELAGKDLVIGYNRWIRKSRGYANKFYPRVENDIRNGSWLIDKTGRLAGLYVNARRGHERILPYLMGEEYAYFSAAEMSLGQRMSGVSARSYYYGHDSETELVTCDVLAPIVANLEAHYDPHIRHLSKDEQKRRVWLGVEYTGLSKEMAKQLNLRKETHDGRIGLMINRVYAGSPAAKMGLVEGDILLKLKVAQGPWPIELMYGAYEDVEGLDHEDMEIPEEYEAMGYQMPRRRPWSSRNNFFTRMLYAIGAGVPTTLTYMHEGKQLEQEFTIEQAPRDSLSANKFKDEKLGITVKDLTYEVRAGLKLSADEKGVVVSKVEPGTPTALARINTFELIRAADGRTLGTVEEFEASIRNAKEQGKDSIRLTVEWMGKTRLADLKFQAKGPNLNDMMRLLPGMPGSNEEDEF